MVNLDHDYTWKHWDQHSWEHWRARNAFDGHGAVNAGKPQKMEIEQAKTHVINEGLAGFTYEPATGMMWRLKTILDPCKFAHPRDPKKPRFDVYVKKTIKKSAKVFLGRHRRVRVFLSHTGRTSTLAAAIKGFILAKVANSKVWSMEDIPTGAGSGAEARFNEHILSELHRCDVVVGICDQSCRNSHPKWGCPAEWEIGRQLGKAVLILYLGQDELTAAKECPAVTNLVKLVQFFPLPGGPAPDADALKMVKAIVENQIVPRIKRAN